MIVDPNPQIFIILICVSFSGLFIEKMSMISNIFELLKFGEQTPTNSSSEFDPVIHFERNYSDCLVKICGLNQTDDITSVENEIVIRGSNLVLSFLEVFGTKIKYICLDEASGSWENLVAIESGINKNCRNNLLSLCLMNIPIFSGFSFTYPFTELVHLCFSGCFVNENLCNVRKTYPNICSLYLVGTNNIVRPYKLIASLPNLNHFYCDVFSLSREHLHMLKLIRPNLSIVLNVRAIERVLNLCFNGLNNS